jgi:hypothetical protein
MKTGFHGFFFVWVSLWLRCSLPVLAQTVPAPIPDFAGKYSDLLPDQKRLVDDWMQRFSDIVQKPVAPEEGYNNLPVSTKTTFYGVTHALIKTKMTGQSGDILAESAVAIVDKVDSVAGDIPWAGGDEQFRIYVQLKPGTQDLLARSQEFSRKRDNTVYHKGYPVCFRSNTGTPSIQVSMTTDGKRADIDVDYHSSKIPACLINGHLSAGNSDVRAGDNDQRHDRTWNGLQSWWQSLLGLPLSAEAPSGGENEAVIPREPGTKAGEKPEVAVHDFLNSWLVEQEPGKSMAYLGKPCFACMELETGQAIDRGMAKFRLLHAMMETNKRLGKISSLSEVSTGMKMSGPRVKLIEQPFNSQFALYNVREDAAEQFLCPNQLDPSLISAKALKSKAFGKYVAAVFRLKTHEQEGRTLVMLWAKDEGYWRVLSYDIDPIWDKYQVPDTSPAKVAAAPALPVVRGDEQLVSAAGDFLKSWLVTGNLDRAYQSLSARCYGCINIYRDEDEAEAQTPEEAEKLVREAMKQIAETAGKVKSLKDALEAPQPHHDDIKLVKHTTPQAFVIVSIPDYMAEAADCTKLTQGGMPNFADPGSAKKYGNYYAVGFRLKKGGPGADILWLVWGKEGGAWKIISYAVIAP